jgi:hypothetical protein
MLPKPRADDMNSSHQFEEEIGAASSEDGVFIAKMEFAEALSPGLVGLYQANAQSTRSLTGRGEGGGVLAVRQK